MRNRKQLVWRIADLAESYCTDLEPQHILISGAEGSGKTFMIEKLAEEFTARGFLLVKYLYPHSNIVGTLVIFSNVIGQVLFERTPLNELFDKTIINQIPENDRQLSLW